MENNSIKKTTPIRPSTSTSSYVHVQPQAPEVEKAVLGAQLIDNRTPLAVYNIVKPEIYYDPRHKVIQEAIRTLVEKNLPIDILTVTQQLSKMGKLDEVGGPSYIAEISSRVSSSANVEYHAQIIAEKSLARQIIDYGTRISERGFDETEDPKGLLEDATNILFDLATKNSPAEYRAAKEILSEALNSIREASAAPDGVSGVASFEKLDRITHGWQKGDLIIVAGRPAMGKTSFALSAAKKVAVDNKISVGFFSLEMNRTDLMKRLISNTCEINGSCLQSGRLLPEEWDRIYTTGNELHTAPLYIDDTPGMSIMDIYYNATRMVKEKGVKLLFIDYLQLIHSGRRYATRQEEVSTISRALKTLAQKLEIPIIVLSQLNRSVEHRDGLEGKRPLLSDLRESGAIEQDADIVIFVHRPEYYHIFQDENGNDLRGMAQIIIAKHRKGAIGDVLLNFFGQYTRFEE